MHPRHPLHGMTFILVGRFPGTSQTEIRERLGKFGARVVPRRTRRADYVVEGVGADLLKQKALFKGALLITHTSLAKMLGPHFDADAEGFASIGHNPANGALELPLDDERLTLSVEHGEETVLDLRTGAITQDLVFAIANSPIISAHAVNDSLLGDLMIMAQIPYTLDANGEVCAQLFNDIVTLEVDATCAWVRLIKVFDINPRTHDAVKYEVANRLNVEWKGARFFIAAPDKLVADTHLTFAQGLSARELVATMQGFVLMVQEALRGSEDVARLA